MDSPDAPVPRSARRDDGKRNEDMVEIKRAQYGTANSAQAVATGNKARMISVFAWPQVRSTEVPYPTKET